jgi:hypothetical protein
MAEATGSTMTTEVIFHAADPTAREVLAGLLDRVKDSVLAHLDRGDPVRFYDAALLVPVRDAAEPDEPVVDHRYLGGVYAFAAGCAAKVEAVKG